MKKFLAVILSVLLIAAMFVPCALADYLGTGTIVNCEEWVSLRVFPSTSASRVMTIPRGAKVEVYECDSEFYEVCYKNQWGYVLRSYVDCVNGGNYNHYLGQGKIVKCNEFVSLRAYASTSAERICTVPKGSTVNVYSCDNSRRFYFCTFGDFEGYILKEYVSIR